MLELYSSQNDDDILYREKSQVRRIRRTRPHYGEWKRRRALLRGQRKQNWPRRYSSKQPRGPTTRYSDSESWRHVSWFHDEQPRRGLPRGSAHYAALHESFYWTQRGSSLHVPRHITAREFSLCRGENRSHERRAAPRNGRGGPPRGEWRRQTTK